MRSLKITYSKFISSRNCFMISNQSKNLFSIPKDTILTRELEPNTRRQSKPVSKSSNNLMRNFRYYFPINPFNSHWRKNVLIPTSAWRYKGKSIKRNHKLKNWILKYGRYVTKLLMLWRLFHFDNRILSDLLSSSKNYENSVIKRQHMQMHWMMQFWNCKKELTVLK